MRQSSFSWLGRAESPAPAKVNLQLLSELSSWTSALCSSRQSASAIQRQASGPVPEQKHKEIPDAEQSKGHRGIGLGPVAYTSNFCDPPECLSWLLGCTQSIPRDCSECRTRYPQICALLSLLLLSPTSHPGMNRYSSSLLVAAIILWLPWCLAELSQLLPDFLFFLRLKTEEEKHVGEPPPPFGEVASSVGRPQEARADAPAGSSRSASATIGRQWMVFLRRSAGK